MVIARSRLDIPEKLNPSALGVTHRIEIAEFYDNEVVEQNTLNTLVLKFNDSEFPVDEDAPTFEQVESIIKWLEVLPEASILLITCFAGVSRSTAIAALAHAVLEFRVKNRLPKLDELKENLIHSCRGTPSPNGLILAYGDLVFNTTLFTDLFWAFKT